MNRLNIMPWTLAIILSVALSLFFLWLVYHNYSTPNKSMVEETIREMVKPEALKPTTSLHRIITVTAYSPRSGKITASGQKVRPGIIALSRDLERDWGVKFGDMIHLPGIGLLEFQDRMHHYWTERVDVYHQCYHEAKRFGIKTVMIGG